MKEQLLPYFEERKTPVDMIVLHASAFPAEKLLYYLDYYKCSCHYVLDENAELIKVCGEEKCAFHAGKGYWRGAEKSVNQRSIGIEICNMSLGQHPYDEKQIDKLIPFCRKLVRKYAIPLCNVVGHSDVAPARKADPGPAFPWKRLAREGLGLWYEPKNAAKMAEDDTARLLSIIGYDTASEEAVRASAYAFCRRFLPQFVQLDEDVAHLVDNVLPDEFGFMAETKFKQVLKAAAYSYLNYK